MDPISRLKLAYQGLSSVGNSLGGFLYDTFGGGNDKRAASEAAYSNTVNNLVPRQTAPVASNITTPSPVVAPAPRVVTPPRLDFAAVQSQARSAAENAVNPYYTKLLGDFLGKQSAQRAQRQAQADFETKDLEDTLTRTLKDADIARTRAAEDVAKNLDEINTTADEFQTDSGQATDAQRLEEGRALADSGLTGGLAAQQSETADTQRNTAEKRQVRDFQRKRTEQTLFKTRTFEDLSRSSELATEDKEKGVKRVQFDLDSFIKDQDLDKEAERTKLEAERLQAVGQEQTNQAKLAYARYLANIRDPAQLAAASQIYGGIF